MTRRSKGLVGVVLGAIGVLVAALLAVSAGSGAELTVAGSNAPWGADVRDAPAGGTWSFGAIILCLSEPARAVIDEVQPVQPTGGLSVDTFAIRPSPFRQGREALGEETVPLANIGEGFVLGSGSVIDGRQDAGSVCPTAGYTDWSGGIELGVQVSKPTAARADDQGLIVSYDIDGAPRSLTIQFQIVLCAAGSQAHCP